MTDNTANEGLWLPNDIWATIASFLDNEDLARFRQLCSATQFVGPDVFILQPHYNRLYAIDKTLPPLLPQEDTLAAFKQASEKVQANQQTEIAYLTEHHPVIMAKPEYVQVFQECTAVSLKSLEAKSAVLDKINSEIITARIDINSSSLNLNNACITRFSMTLFQELTYAHFWQNLTHLHCENNQLTALNVQDLSKLQELWCSDNQLAVLNMKGLAALRWLGCDNNQLTTLNVQGMVLLQWLGCNNNPLMDLNLTAVHGDTKNKYAELERSLLFNKLSQTESVEARQAIIRRLDSDYTYDNCLKYCPVYATTLFEVDSANSALSQASAFLPSFETANTSPEKADLKRKCNEDEMRIEGSSEDYDNQPDIKKRERQ